jgi:biopolymer transport protein ExbD
MAFSAGGRGPFMGEMNVTPMIDLLLVLIVMFMVIVAMSREHMVEAQLPQQENKQAENTPPPERTIVIQVSWNARSKEPEVKINRDRVAWNELEPQLARIFLGRGEKVAFVKGDDDLDFEYVAQVIADAHNAGVDRVGLITSQQFSLQ